VERKVPHLILADGEPCPSVVTLLKCRDSELFRFFGRAIIDVLIADFIGSEELISEARQTIHSAVTLRTSSAAAAPDSGLTTLSKRCLSTRRRRSPGRTVLPSTISQPVV
jgi:hypothetical protein